MVAKRDLPPVEVMVGNIINIYRLASERQRTIGMNWYPDAKRFAEKISARFNVSIKSAIAVIAAVSPQTSWERNKIIATDLLRIWSISNDPEAIETVRGISTRDRLRRASLALQEDFSDIERTARTQKVFNFNRAIAGDLDAVTVDRHAIRVALDAMDDDAIGGQTSGGLTDAAYVTIADAYRKAAAEIGISARDLQAVVWTVCEEYRANRPSKQWAGGVL